MFIFVVIFKVKILKSKFQSYAVKCIKIEYARTAQLCEDILVACARPRSQKIFNSLRFYPLFVFVIRYLIRSIDRISVKNLTYRLVLLIRRNDVLNSYVSIGVEVIDPALLM